MANQTRLGAIVCLSLLTLSVFSNSSFATDLGDIEKPTESDTKPTPVPTVAPTQPPQVEPQPTQIPTPPSTVDGIMEFGVRAV